MTDIHNWFDTAAGNNTGSTPNYPIEGMAPSSVNDTMREMMAALARWYADTNGTIDTGGTGNAYTITPSQTISSYARGQVFMAEADRDNTGSATLNVSALGAKSIIRPDGSAVGVGEIQSGGVYFFVYDGTAFQIIGSTPASLTLTSTTAVDLADADNVLNVGATTGEHLAMDGNDIQKKDNATTAGVLNLNRLGGNVNIGAQSGTGTFLGWYDTAVVIRGDAEGIRVQDTSGTSPRIFLADDSNTSLAHIRQASGQTQVANLNNGGTVALIADDGAGTPTNLLVGDPDGAVTAYFDGAVKLATQANGIDVGSGDNVSPDASGNGHLQISGLSYIGYVTLDGTAMYIGHNSASRNLVLQVNETDVLELGTALITAKQDLTVEGDQIDLDNSGAATEAVYLLRNSEGGVRFFTDGGDVHLRQVDSDGTSNPEDWIVANRNGSTDLYQNGTLKFRTALETFGGNGTGAKVVDGGGTEQPVGLHVTPIENTAVSTNLRLANTGFQIRCTSAVTVDMDTTTDSAPNGAVWIITNESGGNVSLTATGVVLTWLDGAGGQTGNRTVADGSYVTVTKRANGQYQVAGNGLS